MKFTIIGAGNMGESIARGLVGSPFATPSDLTCTVRTDTSFERLKALYPDSTILRDNRKAIEGADVIVVAVRHAAVDSVFREIAASFDPKRQIVVSVAAEFTFSEIIDCLGMKSAPVQPTLFRIIPNTAISIRQSMTFIAAYHASQDQEQLICDVFSRMGQTAIVPEDRMEAGTSLASCGIAFAMQYIGAAVEGGKQLGFTEEEATHIVLQTVKGATQVLLEHGTSPQTEIARVATPGGVTERGLKAMEKQGFSGAVIAGLKASL